MGTDRREMALDATAHFRREGIDHFIGGKSMRRDGVAFDVLDRSTGDVLGQARDATAEEVEAAAEAAAAVGPGWAATSRDKRKQLLHRLADIIIKRADEIAVVECLDAGQALRFMSKAAIHGAGNFRFFADRARRAANGVALPTQRLGVSRP